MVSLANPLTVRSPENLLDSAAPAIFSLTIDAVGEYVDFWGHVYWDGAPTSKVLSSAGGAIVLRFHSSNTFANASTNLRIGIQDVNATTGTPARGDGTYDVQADLVGGTDTITNSVLRSTAMESGTKTISHGQLIAIRIEMTARGGVDSVQVSHSGPNNIAYSYPGITHNTASPAAAFNTPIVQLVADDGTAGWLVGATLMETATNRVFDSATATADEYASIIQFPIELSICGLCFMGQWTTAGGLCKAILYSDPLGTPVAEREVTIDTDQKHEAQSRIVRVLFASAYTVPANTKIALSLQPQDASGDVSTYEIALGSAITGRMKQHQPLGGTWSKGTRLDATGALTEDADAIMLIGALVDGITVAAGGGGVIGGGTKHGGKQ